MEIKIDLLQRNFCRQSIIEKSGKISVQDKKSAIYWNEYCKNHFKSIYHTYMHSNLFPGETLNDFSKQHEHNNAQGQKVVVLSYLQARDWKS